MNNKDLFNAINDIDEKFIADAGKYLSDDDIDDPLHAGAVEIYPGKTRFSPLKLVASIAAAAVFITGISIALNHYRGRISIDPNTGDAASVDAASAAEGAQRNGEASDLNIGTHAPTPTGPLPFELIGPDEQQLWYEDIINVDAKIGDDTPTIEEISEDNWDSVTLGFAYYALPNGCNYNSVDNSDANFAKSGDLITRGFRRLYNGNAFGDLTVMEAYSKLKRETFTNPDTGEQREVTYLSENYIEFDGEMTAEIYLVNDGDGDYYCFFRNGADYLPVVGYETPNFLEKNEYASQVRTFESKSGFKYAGDMPIWQLEGDEITLIEPYLSNANYLKATATFTNVKITGNQDIMSTGFTYNADMTKISLRFVNTDVTDSNLFGETPFTAETEMQLRAILGSARDASELVDNEEIKSLTGCTDIRVFNTIDGYGNSGEEITEGELVDSNTIKLYSGSELLAAYRYVTLDGVITL